MECVLELEDEIKFEHENEMAFHQNTGQPLKFEPELSHLQLLKMIPDYERCGEQHTSRNDLLQRGLEKTALGCQRVDPLVEYGDEDQDERGVDEHHLVRVKHESAELSVHARGLKGPTGALERIPIV